VKLLKLGRSLVKLLKLGRSLVKIEKRRSLVKLGIPVKRRSRVKETRKKLWRVSRH